MNRETKKLIYKQVDGLNGDETLQSGLHKALSRYATAAKRVESLGADGGQVRFINVHRKHQGLILGIFHRLTKGAGQYVIAMPDSDSEWPVELITAGTDAKLNREFVEGTLYFTLWKNHLVMHQSNACRADQFEGYCTWLLSKNRDAVPLLSFSDPVPPDVRKKSKLPVTSIKFGSTFTSKATPTRSEGKQTRVHFSPVGGVWEGIKSILKEIKADVPDEWYLDDALGAQDIKVAMELSCTKKKAQSSAGTVLGTLGQSLRHSEADVFEVSLADGTKIRSEQMKIETSVRVECVQRQPTPESIFKSMVEWMKQLADNGTIVEREAFANVE